MKAGVLYFSKTQNTQRCSEDIAKGLAQVPKMEAKIFSISDVDWDFLKESKILVFGSPTYMAQPPHQISEFFYSLIHSKMFAGKLAGAFATQQYEHGGGQLVIQAIMAYCLTLGMLLYSGGSSMGSPVVHLGPVGNSHRLEETKEIFQVFGTRLGLKAVEIFK